MTAKHGSTAPIGRSAGAERTIVLTIGSLALLAGVAALLVGTGVFGTSPAQRPVLDPALEQWWVSSPQVSLPILIVLGVVLLIAGVWWTVRSLRPQPHPDVLLESTPTDKLTVTSGALTDAVRADAETITGVQRAHVRMRGNQPRPALGLTLSLREGTDVRQVWAELDDSVLSRVRQALDTDTVRTAIHLRLDRAPRQRVH